MQIYKFGDFYLNITERRIVKNRKFLQLSPKTSDVLQFLIEKRGEIISKDEMLGEVWDGSFIEEGNLAVHISRLRKLFGADKAKLFIETVSGSGYRFVERVRAIEADEWKEYISESQNSTSYISAEKRGFHSIAVLPLKNENGNEEIDYLADGLTESIINDLSQLPELKVISRNSVFRYKDVDVSIREIGEKLDVEAVLTGRIRVVRDNLIISIELINAKDRTQLWGRHLNQPFEDIFEMQEKITRAVSANLKCHLDKANNVSLIANSTHDAESYRLYLKGIYLLNKKSIDDVYKAIESFQQSISKDPTNAHSYIGLANSHRLLYLHELISREQTLSRISPLLEKAIELNPLIPDLYTLKGIVNLFLEFDIYEAERNLKKALELNPNSADAHYRYARLLIYSQRPAESLTHIKKCTTLDPISLGGSKNTAKLFYCMEQYENALIKLEECLELETGDFEIHFLLGAMLTELGDYDEALNAYQKSLTLQNYSETILMIGYTYALAGNIKAAEETIENLKELSKKSYISPMNYGIIYAALGKMDECFGCLEDAFEERSSDLIGLRCDPRFKKVRCDPRFNTLLRKIGLPVGEAAVSK